MHAGSDHDLTWRYATAADLLEFYGLRPAETTRAAVVLMGGVPAAVVGIALTREHARFFSDVRPELRPHLKRMPVLRAIKAAMRFVEAYRGPVLAVRDPFPESEALLRRLGFEYVDTQDVGEIYEWAPSSRPPDPPSAAAPPSAPPTTKPPS